MKEILVIVESPFAEFIDRFGNTRTVEENILYARECVRDSLMQGEAPIASHLLYTQDGILNDYIPSERKRGIDAGLAWRKVAEKSVVYVDYGITKGMEYGIAAAKEAGIRVEYRYIKNLTR